MRQHLFFANFTLLTVWSIGLIVDPTPQARAGDSWMFRPSYFTHSPITGERVNQYRPEDPAYAVLDPNYQESGFRYQQYDLNVGGNQDHLHIVQTWGQGTSIRPYGEWQYPYRAGATPYGPWSYPYNSWSSPYGQGQPSWGRPSWGGGGGPGPYGAGQYGPAQYGPAQYGPAQYGPAQYGYGMNQNGAMPYGAPPLSGSQFGGPQAGVGQSGTGQAGSTQFVPQVPQGASPSGQGSATPKVQGPVAF